MHNYRMGLYPKVCKNCTSSHYIAGHNVRMCMVESERNSKEVKYTVSNVHPNGICNLWKKKETK